MKKLFILTLFGLLSTLGASALTISGPSSVCSGSSTLLSDSTSPGGMWTSSAPGIAYIDSLSGFVTGGSAGVCTITYTLGASFATMSFTVNPAPTPIAGPTHVCAGSYITETDATTGGTWMSTNPSVATIGLATGLVGGVASGTTQIWYTLPTGCYTTRIDTVSGGILSDSISGPSSVCVGATITLHDYTTPGGTWSSSSILTATVGASTGVVTGVSSGTVTITYTVSTTCGAAMVFRTVTVGSTTSAGTISGASTVTALSSISLYDGVSGGTWSSSNTSIATVTGGYVTGVAAGVATISYAVTGCGGTAYATHPVTVNPFDGIAGHVIFDTAYYGSVKVWLIKYNPTTHILYAVDSTTASCSGGTSAFYQFTGCSTDSFRVKAAQDSAIISAGYVPTYHTSSYYWHDADVIYHISGTSDINKDINMISGTPTSGPGFIGGDVMTGANKGSTGSVPVPNLLVLAINSTTGVVMQQTYTNAAGVFSFSGLPYGTYLIHPELINYATIPYTSINLTSAAPTMTVANFIEHTISMTITPVNVGVSKINTPDATVVAYPNPTSGKLNIVWNEATTESATLIVSDITGRVVNSSTVNMNQGTGMTQVDLSGLTNGFYLLNIKSGNLNYNNKIQLQH